MTDTTEPDTDLHGLSLWEWLERIQRARQQGDFFGAFDDASRGLRDHPDELELHYEAVRALADARALEQADRRLAEIERSGRIDALAGARGGLWQDLVCLRGRLFKENAFGAQGASAHALFRSAAAQYRRALERTNDYFPAINAATMSHFAGDRDRAALLASQALARATGGDYWARATVAEASILLGDVEGARRALGEARRIAAGNWDSVASTRRQLRKLLPTTAMPVDLLDELAPPAVLCLVPEPFGPGEAGAATGAGPELGAAVGAALGRIEAAAAFATLLTPADLVAAEAVLARNIKLWLVLPCAVESCRAGFLRRYGLAWDLRFFDCIEQAAGITVVTADGRPEEETLLAACGRQIIGMALLRGDALAGAAVYRLAIAAAAAGVGGQPLAIRPLLADATEPVALAAAAEHSKRVDRALIFGDVRGFSKLGEREHTLFFDGILGGFADVLDRYRAVIEHTTTAGDGIYVVLRDVAAAAECCLGLQQVVTPAQIAKLGLPPHLALRLSAHVGPVTPVFDRIINQPNFYGTEITRTARIEPVTPVGQIYVTEQFAATLYHADRRFHCDYVGIQPMAKGFGACRMHALRLALR